MAPPPISHSFGGNLPWFIRRPSRIVAAIIDAAVAYLATSRLPDELNLLIPYDVALAVYFALFGVFMQWASPEDAAEIARQHTGERVGGTESYRQVHSDRDEMRKFERPFNRDQQAIRPVLTLQPGIDFVFCPLQAVKA